VGAGRTGGSEGKEVMQSAGSRISDPAATVSEVCGFYPGAANNTA
jgi:hypothetical protein